MTTDLVESGCAPLRGSSRARHARAGGYAIWLLCGLLMAACQSSAFAAIGISMQTSSTSPIAGNTVPFSYTLTLTNLDAAGPSQRIFLTDPLPRGALFVDVSVSGTNAGGFSCIGPAIGTNGTVYCECASIPGSGTAQITILARYTANMAAQVRTNTARVVSGGVANSASQQQTVLNDANQSITRLTGVSGEFGITRIAVANSGLSSVVNAMHAEALPTTANFVSVNGTGALASDCSYDPTTRTVLCAADFLPSGTAYITVVTTDSAQIFRDGFE